MKRLIVILAMLAFSTAVFAQDVEHVRKGNEFARQTAVLVDELIETEDDTVLAKLEDLGVKLGEYLVKLETETEVTEFFKSYEKGIYFYFEKYGIGEEFANEYLKSMYEGILELIQ